MPANDFAAFQQHVWSDASLQAELFALREPALLMAHVEELAKQRGYELTEAELRQALQLAQRAWIERGIG